MRFLRLLEANHRFILESLGIGMVGEHHCLEYNLSSENPISFA